MTDAALSGAVQRQPMLVPGLSARLQSRGAQVAVLPAVAAWTALILLPLSPLALQICATLPVGSGAGAAFAQALALEWVSFQPTVAALEWVLMIVAMMLPLTLAHIDYLSARTFRDDRWGTILAFVSGYLLVWMLVAIPSIGLVLVMRAGLHSFGPSAGAPLIPLALAAWWWVARPRKRALARCHYRPALPAQGAPAIWGGGHMGLVNGTYCVITCLPLMLGMQIAGGGVTGMALLGVMIFAERAAHRPDPKGAALVLIAFGAPLSLI